jgi:hypothetical protein
MIQPGRVCVFPGMNIFVLDKDVTSCARYHCDQHVGKMILESAQILCTALNKKGFETPYKSTHVKHPCVLWVEESYANFRWLMKLARALNTEFCWRHDRDASHASIQVLDRIESFRYPGSRLSPFPQAMPDKYKVHGDPVLAYRNFYIGEKARFATWKKRSTPDWFNLS